MENLKIEAKMNPNLPEDDPRYHTARIKQILQGLVDHLRADESKIKEPKAQALFETSAEVLIGLVTAFDHYENRSEEAMRA
jgi:hypothetical protein